MVRRGGRNPHRGPRLDLFGPEALTALSGNRSGQQQAQGPASAAAGVGSAGAQTPTAYATGERATTAGVGASFSPGEQVLIEEYFRRLHGDPAAPPPAPVPP
jgi:hypothetical protein